MRSRAKQTDAAPVRVAAANALSIVVSLCPEALVSLIIGHVGVLLQQELWDVRLSGMLAVKGILRVCRANVPVTLAIIDLVSLRLHDDDDDVRAVITDSFSIALPAVARERAELLPKICIFVWQALNGDLGSVDGGLLAQPILSHQGNFQGAFTEPMLKLLAALYTTQQSLAWADGQPIPIANFELLSKFTRDPRKHCRREAARSIEALCSAYAKEADRMHSDWKTSALTTPARYIFEALLMEREIDATLGLHNALGSAWRELLLLCGDDTAAAVFAPHVSALFSMACTPIGAVRLVFTLLLHSVML
jgi:hypothetical protein